MAQQNPEAAAAAELLLKDIPRNQSQPVRWYRLILEMERFRFATGMGLANCWGLVQNEDYEAAVSEFEQVESEYGRQQRDQR